MVDRETIPPKPAPSAIAVRQGRSKVLTVAASALASALAPIKPNKPEKKPYVVVLEARARARTLSIEEAKHGLFAATVPAKGSLPPDIQVDGKMLGRVAASLPNDATIEMSTIDEFLDVRSGKVRARLPRIDLTPAKVKMKRRLVDPKHKGKVEPRLEGRHIRQRGQTWGFSANVPFKADRRDGDREDE